MPRRAWPPRKSKVRGDKSELDRYFIGSRLKRSARGASQRARAVSAVALPVRAEERELPRETRGGEDEMEGMGMNENSSTVLNGGRNMKGVIPGKNVRDEDNAIEKQITGANVSSVNFFIFRCRLFRGTLYAATGSLCLEYSITVSKVSTREF